MLKESKRKDVHERPHTYADNWRRFLGVERTKKDYTKHFIMLNLLYSMPSTWQDKTTNPTLHNLSWIKG